MSTPVEHHLAPLRPYLDQKDAIEIKAVNAGEIHVENQAGTWKRVQVPGLDKKYWWDLGYALSISSGQRFEKDLPVLRATLPGGHRLFLTMGPNTIDVDGRSTIVAAIRLKRTLATKLEQFGIDMNGERELVNAVKFRRNILIAGSTGSGKTTLTRILCQMIEDEGPVSIEDTPELHLTQPIAARFVISAIAADTKMDYRHVMDALTRVRPDRLILGEMTIDNAFILMRMLNMGQQGVIGTIHADRAKEATEAAAELMCLSGYAKGEEATINYLDRKIDRVVFVERAGRSRVISEIFQPEKNGPGKMIWARG